MTFASHRRRKRSTFGQRNDDNAAGPLIFSEAVPVTISPRMTFDLTDEETAALTKHLRQAIDCARYPLAPRLDPLKAILAKLEPPEARARK